MAALVFWAVFYLCVPAGNLPSNIQPLNILLAVLIYPVLEEAAFRGWLQGRFLAWTSGQKKWQGISLANLLTSLAFMSVHFFYHSWWWALAVIVPSLVFGYFRERYQSILPGTALHIWYNAGYYIFIVGFGGSGT